MDIFLMTLFRILYSPTGFYKESNCSDFTIHESRIYSETTECNMWCTLLKHYYFKRKLIMQTIIQSLQAPLYIKYISSVLLLPFFLSTLITNAIFACTLEDFFFVLELLILYLDRTSAQMKNTNKHQRKTFCWKCQITKRTDCVSCKKGCDPVKWIEMN